MTVKSSALLSTKIFAGRWRSDEGDLSSWQQSGKRAGRNKKMQATETFLRTKTNKNCKINTQTTKDESAIQGRDWRRWERKRERRRGGEDKRSRRGGGWEEVWKEGGERRLTVDPDAHGISVGPQPTRGWRSTPASHYCTKVRVAPSYVLS